MGKRVFVTVGTTKFDKLIKTVSSEEILNLLHDLGYSEIQFQTGTTCFDNSPQNSKVRMKFNQYFENFAEQIRQSDLVISHAGAGTCLEVLKQQKPLIVVINEDLMDNHQKELADQLQEDGYLYYATPENLREILSKDLRQLKVYPKADPKLFANYLDKCMGFT